MSNELEKQRTMSLWEITKSGRELESMFVYGDLDEDTMKDSQEFLVAELKQKSSALIYVYKLFEYFVGKKYKRSEEDYGAVDKEIKRLQELKKEYNMRFENYKTRLAEAMYSIGMNTGKANGIMTDRGIITMTKSQSEIKPDLNDVDDKYKLVDVKLKNLTYQQLDKLEEFTKENNINIEVSEPKLNKDLYKVEVGILMQQNYSMTIK